MNWYKLILFVLLGLNALVLVASIGKPVRPISNSIAVQRMLMLGAMAALVAYA